VSRYLVIALAALLAALPCSAAAGPRRPPASAGPRVVSLAPNITEIVDAIGAGGQLVGRSSALRLPADILARVPVSGIWRASLERLLTVSPDLVLYADLADNAFAGRLKRAGLRGVRVRCTRLDEIALPSARWASSCNVNRGPRHWPPMSSTASGSPRGLSSSRQAPFVSGADLARPDHRRRTELLSLRPGLAGRRPQHWRRDRPRLISRLPANGAARDPDIILCFVMAAQRRSPGLGSSTQPGWTGEACAPAACSLSSTQPHSCGPAPCPGRPAAVKAAIATPAQPAHELVRHAHRSASSGLVVAPHTGSARLCS